MATLENARAVVEEVRHVRQARLYRPDPVPADVLDQLLEIARWTGSSRNTQPWHFVVVTDKEKLRQLSQLRPTRRSASPSSSTVRARRARRTTRATSPSGC